MFKKTLLALTVAAISGSAAAGSIYSSVSTTVPTLTTTELGTGVAYGNPAGAGVTDAAGDDCHAFDALLSVTKSGVTPAETDGTNDDVATLAAAAYTYSGTDTVASNVYTSGEECTITYATTASSATSKSPIEQTGTISVNAVIVAGAGGYRQEDTLTINFSGAKIKTGVIPTLATSASGAVFELLDITATTVRFTVKSGSADVPANAIINLTGVNLDTTGLTSGTKVSIDTFATNTSGTQYDVIAATAIHELVPQYSAVVSRNFDGVINVSDDRQSLVDEDTANAGATNGGTQTKDHLNEDTMFITVTKDANTNEVDAESTTLTVTGDFSWVAAAANVSDDGKDATAAEISAYLNSKNIYSFGGAAWGDADSYALNATNTTLTIVDSTNVSTAANAATTYSVRLVVPGKADNNPVLQTQDFTVAAVVSNGLTAPNTITMDALSATEAGSWTLNGSVVEVPYMPFGPNTQPIIRHTNTGAQTGDISVRYMVEDNEVPVHTSWQDLGIIVDGATPGVRNLRALITDKLVAAGFDPATNGFKVALEVTTNVPGSDVTVYAAAKITAENQDRLTVGAFKSSN